MQRAIIVLAAGKGTRMNSDLPKVAIPFNTVPMIRRLVTAAELVNFDRIVTVVGHKQEIVRACLNAFPYVRFVEQTEQRGTGHAVLVTQEEFRDFSGTILITPGDVPLLSGKTMETCIAFHEKNGANVTVLTAILDDPQQYGRIVRDQNNQVKRIVEHRDATEAERAIHEINTGIYCFDAQTLFSVLPKISANNSQHEIYLTDSLEIIEKQNGTIAAVVVDNPDETAGINSMEELQMLEKKVMKNT